MGRLDITNVGFKAIVDSEFEKPRVPFFCRRIDDCTDIVVEDGSGNSSDDLEKFYMGSNDLKERFP
jgi:hypothetical protein